MKSTSAKKAPATRFPLKKTSTTSPISKGTVKTAQPKGFPATTKDAYRTIGGLKNTVSMPPKQIRRKKK